MTTDQMRDVVNSELTKRDYLSRLDVFYAITNAAPSAFIEQDQVRSRREDLNKIPWSKWLWAGVVAGAVLSFLGFSLGTGVLVLCGGIYFSAVAENILAGVKAERISQQLHELCFRWIANGLPGDDFWRYGRLAVRESTLALNEAESAEFRKDNAEWWRNAKRRLELRSQGKDDPFKADLDALLEA
jgi:hypothetical protein